MNISEVKTSTKIGDFSLLSRKKNKITLNYRLSGTSLTNDAPRVYLITQNNIIKKIGGSSSKGGIKATMNFYINAMTGSPGRPRFIIHLLIAEALAQGSNVSLHMITSPKVLSRVNGLFGSTKMKISSFQEMEALCKSDYYSKEKKYPDWNFKENNKSHPAKLEAQFMMYHKDRLKNKII